MTSQLHVINKDNPVTVWPACDNSLTLPYFSVNLFPLISLIPFLTGIICVYCYRVAAVYILMLIEGQ